MTSFKHPSGIWVELLDSAGDDLAIVNAARVSYGKETDWDYQRWDSEQQTFVSQHNANPHDHTIYTYNSHKNWNRCLTEKDAGVLNYMMRERHGTPFEMVYFKFRIHVPIGVVWEWVRHRIASYNVMSTRYVEMVDEFYLPALKDMRTQVGKTGHYTFEPLPFEKAVKALDIYHNSMVESYAAYQKLLDMGVAREVARNVLPMGLFTEFIWGINLRSLFNFLSLRTAPEALYEIQIPAKMVEQAASMIVPEAFNAWRRHGKVTP